MDLNTKPYSAALLGRLKPLLTKFYIIFPPMDSLLCLQPVYNDWPTSLAPSFIMLYKVLDVLQCPIYHACNSR